MRAASAQIGGRPIATRLSSTSDRAAASGRSTSTAFATIAVDRFRDANDAEPSRLDALHVEQILDQPVHLAGARSQHLDEPARRSTVVLLGHLEQHAAGKRVSC